MNSGLNGVSYVITDYRQRLVLKRVLATPAHPVVFLSGLVARYAATNLVQLAVIAVAVFDAAIVGSLWVLAGLAVFGTLVFVGMGMAVSTGVADAGVGEPPGDRPQLPHDVPGRYLLVARFHAGVPLAGHLRAPPDPAGGCDARGGRSG